MNKKFHSEDYVSKNNGFILSDLDGNGNRIINLADPVNDYDAVTKAYADANFVVNTGITMNLGGKRITNLGAGVNPTDGVNVSQVNNYVKKTGDTMLGDLDMNGKAITSTYWNSGNTNPVVLNDDYCVTYGGLKRDVLLKAFPSTTNINMGGYSITNVSEPVNPSDVATKNYVDKTLKKITEELSISMDPKALNSILNLSAPYSWTNKMSPPIMILNVMVFGASNCVFLKPNTDTAVVSGDLRAINTSSTGVS